MAFDRQVTGSVFPHANGKSSAYALCLMGHENETCPVCNHTGTHSALSVHLTADHSWTAEGLAEWERMLASGWCAMLADRVELDAALKRDGWKGPEANL